MTIRIGVAGVAGMGMFHVLNFPKLEGAEVTAICDPWPKALEGAGSLAPEAKPFSDLDEMCASGVVDAVAIATPNSLHRDNIRTALEAGLHVYCEKPLGITVGECREIAALAEQAGRVVQTGFQHRFQHGYASAKRIIAGGEIGPLHRADMRATAWFRPDVYFAKRPWRATWERSGGGVLLMQAIHQLDAFLWIAGLPSSVTARAWSARSGVEVEDDVYAILEFDGGARGMLSASTLDPAGINRLEFACDGGAVRAEGERLRRAAWEGSSSGVRSTSTNPFEAIDVSWEEVEASDDPVTYDDCVAACERDFLDAITSGRPPAIGPAEGTLSVEVANAIYLSALTGETVTLPLETAAYDEAFARMCDGTLSLQEA